MRKRRYGYSGHGYSGGEEGGGPWDFDFLVVGRWEDSRMMKGECRWGRESFRYLNLVRH